MHGHLLSPVQGRLLTDPNCAPPFTHRYTIYKDHVTLADYEIHDGMNLELYYT
jgi:hypothetical protein